MNLQFTPDSALAGGLVLGSMVVAKRLNAGKNLGVSGETKAFAQGRGEATNASFLLGLVAAGYIAPMILGAQAAVPMVEAPRAIVAGALRRRPEGARMRVHERTRNFWKRTATRAFHGVHVRLHGGRCVGGRGDGNAGRVTRVAGDESARPPWRSPEAKRVLYGKVLAAGVAVQASLHTLAKREGGGVTDFIKRLELVGEHFAGLFFGLGLVISGMTKTRPRSPVSSP